MGDNDQETCNTGLGLGIGVGEFMPKLDRPKKKQVVCLDLSFPLQPKEEIIDANCEIEGSSSKTTDVHKISLANNNCNSGNNDDNDSNNKSYSRKKLRLSKEQSTLLEESFKLHSTLNPSQKQTLAEKLNLRPRQVEVWFQNRRARTKLKQTEVDCEFLKRCCESLSDENCRLKKELQEMRSLKFEQPPPPPLYIQFPKAAKLAAICRNCDKIVKADGDTTLTNNTTAKNHKAAAAAAVAMDVVHKPNIKKQSFLDGPS